MVKDVENYIAKVDGPRELPWRMAVVTADDKGLAATDMTYLLAAPSKIQDISWIRPDRRCGLCERHQ